MPLLSIIQSSGFIALGVLFLLLVFSVLSWAIIFFKMRQLNSAWNSTQKFADVFWQLRQLESINETARLYASSPPARIFLEAYSESQKTGELKSVGVERVLHRGCAREISQLERLVPFLATVGSTSPFIGLFGTVVGIMNAFHSIGLQGSASLATVAPGIAESLVATAAGLIAAIPAVIAYNYFSSRIQNLSLELEHFSSDFLSLLKDK